MRIAAPATAAGSTVSAGVTVPTNSTMPNTGAAPWRSIGSFGAAARSSSPIQSAPSTNRTLSATATAKTKTIAAHRAWRMVRVIMMCCVGQGLALPRAALLRHLGEDSLLILDTVSSPGSSGHLGLVAGEKKSLIPGTRPSIARRLGILNRASQAGAREFLDAGALELSAGRHDVAAARGAHRARIARAIHHFPELLDLLPVGA